MARTPSKPNSPRSSPPISSLFVHIGSPFTALYEHLQKDCFSSNAVTTVKGVGTRAVIHSHDRAGPGRRGLLERRGVRLGNVGLRDMGVEGVSGIWKRARPAGVFRIAAKIGRVGVVEVDLEVVRQIMLYGHAGLPVRIGAVGLAAVALLEALCKLEGVCKRNS